MPRRATEGQAAEVKWSRQGIITCFDEQFADVTRCAEGQTITMFFPSWGGSVGCLMTIPLDLPTAKRLLEELSGNVLRLMEDMLALEVEGGVVVVGGGFDFKSFTSHAIATKLSKQVWKYIEAGPGRQTELQYGMQCTDSVSLSISRKYCYLSIAIDTTDATRILDCLSS